MAEKRDNSVLFSLRELRGIEEQRVEEEADSKRRAEEEALRQKMEAERRAREEQEAAIRAQQEAEQQAREEAERRARDEQMRLEEAERRARVEAQAQIEQQRLAKEMEIRALEASKKRPTALIAIAGVLVVAVVGLGVFLYKKAEAADKADRARQEALIAQQQAEERLAKLTAEIEEQQAALEDLQTQLAAADSEAERAALRKKMAAKQAALDRLKKQARDGRRGGRRGGNKPDKDDGTINVKCDPSDPLCGL